MPVAEQALIASGQADTLDDLINNPWPKHHLASDDDLVLFLGDVIAVPQPVGQAISVGDIFTYGGVGVVIVAGMRTPARREDEDAERAPRRRRGSAAACRGLRNDAPAPHAAARSGCELFELALVLPMFAYIGHSIYTSPEPVRRPVILVWIAAIAAVDLLPVPTTVSSVAFSLSFPLELSVALLYPTPVAALIAFAGSADRDELRRELPLSKALWIRAQIAAAVMCESAIFK